MQQPLFAVAGGFPFVCAEGGGCFAAVFVFCGVFRANAGAESRKGNILIKTPGNVLHKCAIYVKIYPVELYFAEPNRFLSAAKCATGAQTVCSGA